MIVEACDEILIEKNVIVESVEATKNFGWREDSRT
jgi:hypothetical protein